LGQRQEKGRGGIFDGFSKMFGSQGQQQQQYSNRRRYNNNDDYARSSTYDRI
jgi:hypothetical protein